MIFSVVDDEETKCEANDQDQEVGEALDQVLGDAVKHEAEASSQKRISGERIPLINKNKK